MTNGNLPGAQLVTIDGHGTRLRDWCAAVWQRMVVDAAAEGVTLKPSYTPPPAPPGLAGYRSYQMQLWLYRHPIGPVPIAMPGYSSHGLGNRLDIGTGVAWASAHMIRYGLYREFETEPWHFGFRNSLAGLGLTPITATTRRKSMTTNYVDTSTYKNGAVKVGTVCATAGDSPGTPANWLEYTRTLKDGEMATLQYLAHGPHVELTHQQFLDYKARYLSPLATTGGIPADPGALRQLRIRLEGTAEPA